MLKLCVPFVLSCFLVALGAVAEAHHPAAGAGIGKAGPIRTIAAATLGRGKGAIGLQTEFVGVRTFSDDRLMALASEGTDVHTVSSVFHAVLGVGYGVTDDLMFSLRLPYERLRGVNEAHAEEPGEVHRHGDAAGIGDISLLGQYRFTGRGVAGDLESALIVGVKLPTGRTDVKDRDGVRFETEFQPGTGSLNPILGIAASKRFGDLSLDADIMYTMATNGSQDTDLGDILNYNLALSHRLVRGITAVDAMLECNGEWRQKQTTRGVRDGNSGGSTIYLSPGVRVVFSRLWSAYGTLGIPVMQDLNGVQDRINIKALVGVGFGF